MDELAELIQTLQKEVSGLEGALRLREAEEDARLKLEEAHLQVAQDRLARASVKLRADAIALAVVEERRQQLLARIDGWRGQLWRIGYSSVPMVAGVMVTTAFPLAAKLLGTNGTLGMFAGQVTLFVALYFLIPEKR